MNKHLRLDVTGVTFSTAQDNITAFLAFDPTVTQVAANGKVRISLIGEQTYVWTLSLIHIYTALLIQGARRVGKSTIAEEFARKEYKSYILIDFSKVSKEVSDLFNDISDLNYLFIRLQFIFQVELLSLIHI